MKTEVHIYKDTAHVRDNRNDCYARFNLCVLHLLAEVDRTGCYFNIFGQALKKYFYNSDLILPIGTVLRTESLIDSLS